MSEQIASALASATSDQAGACLNLDAPWNGPLRRAQKKSLVTVAQTAFDAWLAVSWRRQSLTIRAHEWKCPGCGEVTRYEGVQLRDRVVFTLASYYEYAVSRLTQLGLPKGVALIPGLGELFREQTKSVGKESRKLDEDGLLLGDYHTCCFATFFAGLIRPIASRGMSANPAQEIELIAHQSLTRLHDRARRIKRKSMKTLANQLLHGCLHRIADLYEIRAEAVAPSPATFSALRHSELHSLAERSEHATKQFGKSRVQDVFEQQLALLFQSLGLQVIPCRRGKKEIDLLCVEDRRPGAVTFLVEAKSSKRRYSLPADDSRALEEYVKDVKRRLGSLPALRAVVLVGAKPAKTLEAKLRDLEARIGTPVRWVGASALARLREEIVGSVPGDELVESLLQAGQIVDQSDLKRLVGQRRQVASAHETFVRSLLDASGEGGSHGTDWPHPGCSPRPQG